MCDYLVAFLCVYILLHEWDQSRFEEDMRVKLYLPELH